jgi:hypothetical protein
MTNLVETVKGLIELDDLVVEDVVEVFDNCRKVYHNYYHNGELVKQSVTADMLRSPNVSRAVPGKLS